MIGAAIASLLLRFSYVGLSFAAVVVLTRILDQADFGIYSFALALATVFAIPSQMGIPALATREMARAVVFERWGQMRGFIRWSHFAIGLVSICILAVAGGIYFFRARAGSEAAYTILIGLGLVPIASLAALRAGLLRGMKKVVYGQLPEQLVRPFAFLVFLSVAGVGIGSGSLSPQQAMALQLGSAFVALVVGWVLFAHFRPRAVITATSEYQSKQWFLSAIPLGLSSAMQLLNSQFDILMLGFFKDPKEVALYRIAVQLSLLVSFGLQISNAVLAPYYASLVAKRDFEKLQQLVTRSGMLILAVSAPVLFVSLGYGRQIISVFFGEDYIGAFEPLAVLVLGQFINASLGSVGLLLNMSGNERQTTKALAMAAGVNLVLNLVLVPTFGIIGAAIANLTTLSTWNLLMWRSVRASLGIESIPLLALLKGRK